MKETLEIKSGALGPVPACTLEIRPFSVFIGPQGSGKSLVAQVLYFFRALPGLTGFVMAALARQPARRPSAERVVRELLDGLRSPDRAFAGFANPSASLRWTQDDAALPLGLGLDSRNARTRPDQHLKTYVEESMESPTAESAIFVPTERLFYSQVRSPLAPQLMRLPLTYMLFSAWMQRAAETIDGWQDGPDTPQGRLVGDLGRQALGGEAYRRGRLWKWRFRSGRAQRTLDLDMASSGQRATAPIVLLAETLLSLRRRSKVDPGFTIYVEEPEIHLHPDAQRAIVEVLAVMVRAGFRVVVTTHSLTILYTLNNLVLASDLPRKTTGDVPLPNVRLSKDDVAAYGFGDGAPADLVDRETGFVDERRLGWVSEKLSDQMNRIMALREGARRSRRS
jgi:hypothetical protein